MLTNDGSGTKIAKDFWEFWDFVHNLPTIKITTKLYVTAENRSKLVMYYHENLAHLKTDSIIDARYWWPMMKRDINAIVIRCPKCQLSAPAGDGRCI